MVGWCKGGEYSQTEYRMYESDSTNGCKLKEFVVAYNEFKITNTLLQEKGC